MQTFGSIRFIENWDMASRTEFTGIFKMKASNGPFAILTRQERRVLKLVSDGKTNKEIAVVLTISPATVKRHLENILKKLQLRNRVEAAVYAVRLGPVAIVDEEGQRSANVIMGQLASRQQQAK